MVFFLDKIGCENMEQFKKLAKEQLGLEDLEARCYELILIKSKASVGEICGYVELDRETEFEKVKNILEGLVKKGLAQKLPKAKGLVDVYVGVPPFEGVIKKLTAFTTEMGQAKKVIEQSATKIRADATKNAADTKSHVGALVSQEKAATDQKIAAATQEIAKTADNAVKAHNDALGKGKTSIQQAIDLGINGTRESLAKFQTQVTSEMTTSQGKVGEAVTARKKEVTGTYQQFVQNQTKAVNTFSEVNAGNANQTKDQIVGKLQSLDKIIKELLQRAKETHAEGVTEAQQKAIADYVSHKDLTGKTLEKWIGDLSAALGTTASSAQGQLNTKMTSAVGNSVAKLNETSKVATDKFVTLKKDLTAALAGAKTAFDATLQGQKGELEKYLDQQTGVLEKSLTSQAGTFASGIDAQTKTLETAIGEQNKMLEKDFADLLAQMKNLLDTRKTSIITLLSSMKKQIDASTAGIKTSVSQKFQEYEAGIKKQLETLKTEINTRLQQFASNAASNTEKLTSSASQNVDLMTKATADHTVLYSTQLQTQAQDVAATVTKIFDTAKSNVTDQCKTQINALEKTLGDNVTAYSNKVNGNADAAIKGMAEKTQAVEAQVSAPFQQGCEATTKLLTDFATQLNKSATDLVKQGVDLSKKGETDLVGALSGVQADVTSTLQGFDGVVKTTSAKQTEDIRSTLTTLKQKSEESLTSTVAAFSTATGALKKDLETKVTTLQADVNGSADKINTDTSANLDKFEKTMLESFDVAVQTAMSPIGKVSESAAKNADLLGAIWNDMKGIELLKAEGTWQIVTRHTIQMYIDAMVRRTKMLCVIVVPDMSLLPMNAIRASKKTQKITIASKITDKKLADELAKMQNIDLREVTEYPVNVFGANRDQEEAFYGPATEKPDEMVCTITQQDDLIMVIAEMLSSFYRGRSRKYATPAG